MMDANELSCRELVELVTDYLEDALPLEERRRFEAHLDACEGCTNYLEQMRYTVRASEQLTEEAIPTVAQEKLLDLFRNWKRR